MESHEISLWIGSYQLIDKGNPLDFDRQQISLYMRDCMQGEYLKDDCIQIHLVVGSGTGCGIAWGCDLSDQYVRINADYTT